MRLRRIRFVRKKLAADMLMSLEEDGENLQMTTSKLDVCDR
jgi:hypothetical protein